GCDFDQPVGLGAGGFVAADHVEVDHGAGGGERAQGMGGVVVGSEQSALFGGVDCEDDGALGLDRIFHERFCQRHDAYGAGAVIVGSMIKASPGGRTVVIVMGADHYGFG